MTKRIITKKCKYCKKVFTPNRESVNANLKNQFCSRKCSNRFHHYKEKDYSDRFWAKVDKTGECWNWIGCMRSKKIKRGSFWINGKRHVAYRVAYSLANNFPDMEGMSVCHKCNNPSCVRPSHLYLGDHKANMKDRKKAGNYVVSERRRKQTSEKLSGSKCHKALFDEKDIREIWKLYREGKSKTEISRIFQTSDVVICNIINGKSYKTESEIAKKLYR